MLQVVAGVMVTGLALVGVPTIAAADPSDRVGQVGRAIEAAELKLLQQRGAKEIDRRLSSIDEMKARVADAEAMTDAHKQTLGSLLESDKQQLTALKEKLAAETDDDAARAEVQSIFTKFRVYAIVEPKVHLVRSADAVAAAASDVDSASAQLDTVVARLKATGKVTADAEAALAKAHDRAQAATADVKGAADTALSLEAQNFPGNASQRDASRQAIEKASVDARAALDALRTAVAQLRTASGQ
jgi:vacuolar-type H+-ATPase subunit F/Vma7